MVRKKVESDKGSSNLMCLRTETSFIVGFPAVFCCVDGTFIRLQTPTENEPDYKSERISFLECYGIITFVIFNLLSQD